MVPVWPAKAEVIAAGISLLVPILAQAEPATGAISQWLQHGPVVALVLIHTLWTMPQMRKEQADERTAFMTALDEMRKSFKCSAVK